MATERFDLFRFSADSGAAALRSAIAQMEPKEQQYVWAIAEAAFTAGAVVGAKALFDTYKASLLTPGAIQ